MPKKVSLVVVLVIISGLLLYVDYKTIDDLIGWNIISELKEKQYIKRFTLDNLNKWEVSLPVYYVYEYYLPKQIPNNHWLSCFTACTLIVGTMGILYYCLKISNKYSFILFVSLLVSWAISLEIENFVGTSRNGAFLLLFIPVAILGYSIQTIRAFEQYSKWIWLLLTTVIISFLIYFGETNRANYLSVIINPFYFYLILSSAFLFFLSNSIFEQLIKVISVSTSIKGVNYWNKILMVFLIYLLNVIILYAQEIKWIDVQQEFFTPIVLVVVSLLIGISNHEVWKNDTKLLFWSSLLVMAILHIYMSMNVHEAYKEFINEFITISYTILPTAYLIHLLINFSPVIKAGLPVHKVINKPVNVSWILPQVGAGFLILFFLSFKNGYTVNQIIATKNNLIADYYLEKKEDNIAETYLKKSTAYDLYNHRANFILGGLSEKYGDKSASIYYYEKSVAKYNTSHGYIALAQVLEGENLFFDALFDVAKGAIMNKNSTQLATYQAKLYDKINNQDSTYIYLKRANDNCSSCEVEKMNYVGFWVKNGTKKKINKLVNENNNLIYPKNHPNSSAIIVLSGNINKNEEDILLKSETLSVLDFAILFNRISNLADKSKLNPEMMKKIVENPLNEQFASELMFIEAINLYKNGRKSDGISKLIQLSAISKEKRNIYGNVAFGLLLEQGALEVAKEKLGTYIPKEKQKWLLKQTTIEAFRRRSKENYEALKKANTTIRKSVDSLYQYAPYNTEWIKYLLSKLEKENGEEAAYRFLVNTLENNPHEKQLWKIYIEKSIKMNLLSYAEDGIRELEKLKAEEGFIKKAEDEIKSKRETNTFK